jgi:hypothetical protein
LIEQSFDEAGIREVSCFGAVPMKSGSRSPCAKQHLRFASIPIQHLPLMRQRNALGGASIHLLLQISPNGDAFLHTKWASRRRNMLKDQSSPVSV